MKYYHNILTLHDYMILLQGLMVGFAEDVSPAGVPHHRLTNPHPTHAVLVRALDPQLPTYIDVVPHGVRAGGEGGIDIHLIGLVYSW